MLRILQQFILTTLFALFASQASAMFIQPDWYDPTQPGVGTNRYSYSFNDPINLSDPNGNHVIQDEHGDLYNDSNGDGEHNLDDHVYVGNINDISDEDLFSEFKHDDQRDDNNGRYDPIEYYSGSFGSDITSGNYNPSALSPIHPKNGQAINMDGVLYGAAMLPAATGANAVKGAYVLGGRAAYLASVGSLKAQVAAMRAMGYSKKEIAIAVHKARRNIGQAFKGMTPKDLQATIRARNTQKYGDPLGPSIDYLRGRGKSWDDII